MPLFLFFIFLVPYEFYICGQLAVHTRVEKLYDTSTKMFVGPKLIFFPTVYILRAFLVSPFFWLPTVIVLKLFLTHPLTQAPTFNRVSNSDCSFSMSHILFFLLILFQFSSYLSHP